MVLRAASERIDYLEHVDGSSSGSAERRTARLYESDRSLARIVAEFLHEGFKDRCPGIVIATADQRAAIKRALQDRSLDVDALENSRALLLLDAKEMLSAFIVNRKPDAQKFREQMHRVIERATDGRTDCTVRIFAQMLDLLWQENERDAAIGLEVLWNQLAEREDVSLIYGYAIDNLYKAARG